LIATTTKRDRLLEQQGRVQWQKHEGVKLPAEAELI
jgi:hypothetical protein